MSGLTQFRINKMKSICIRQHDITDCGAACIASVCAFYGLKLPIAQIRQYAHTDKKGTNILGMLDALDKLGFDAKGVKAEFEPLKIIPKPVIAHVVIKEFLQHFVVIYKVSKGVIEYMDPGDGKIHKMAYSEFKKVWTGVLILLEPKETFEKADRSSSNLKRFWKLFRPHKRVLTQSIFGAVIYCILGLSTSVYVGKITDNVLVDGNVNLLNLMSVFMIIIIMLQMFIGYMKSLMMLKTGQCIDVDLILGYYKHILRLPQYFFDTMRVGEIVSRIGDAVKIRNFVNNVVVELCVNSLILVFTVVLMLIYSWKLTFILVLSIPLYGLFFYAFNHFNRKYQLKAMVTCADLQAQLVESLEAIGTIKRFGIEKTANIKTENRFIPMLRTVYKASKGELIINSGIQIVGQIIVVAVLWVGSNLVLDLSITPGTLMMFYSLVNYVTSPISSIISSNKNVQEALIASERLFEIMDLELEETEMDKINLSSEMIGDIFFEHIKFRYGSRKLVFDDFNLIVKKGNTTGIVGESGSGKTTLFSILQKIYPIQSGNIKIGDYNIVNISNVSLRDRICIVPQQVELFAGTIVENIALGEKQPDMKRIVNIVNSLGMQSFINDLPHGFSTMIGEHGVSLSGGERQRISIARAIYRNPDIYLFDEATSSLDTISENFVKNVIQDLSNQGKTIIIIAHRLSTVKDADNIVVINRGVVAEQGRHKDLLLNGGIYAMLWNEQTGGLA